MRQNLVVAVNILFVDSILHQDIDDLPKSNRPKDDSLDIEMKNLNLLLELFREYVLHQHENRIDIHL